jgi:alpha-glucosidase
LWAADQAAHPEVNIYGAHPVYLDTRYFTKDKSGKLTYVANATDAKVDYVSYTHGVFLRNAHGQEAILRPDGITWRTIGGSIDLYIFAGPTAEAVMKDYQRSATGLPAMQQYWTMGFHQCRWGYQNWSVAQGVIDDFAKFELPLETFWCKSTCPRMTWLQEADPQ